MPIQKEELKAYPFLKDMFEDDYFPRHLVEKGQNILIRLCEEIEDQKPKSDTDLLLLTHAATEEFNELAEEFADNDSEIETLARDTIGADFEFIAKTYGFDVDAEELIGPRDW